MSTQILQNCKTDISIAITAFNLENCIQSCCEELFAQSFQNFHIIIYDDCSTDTTRELLINIKTEHPDKVTLIWGEVPLGGPALARNAILNSGKIDSKYVIFLDGDDRIEQDFLEKLYNTAEENNADISLCSYDRVELNTGHVLCREMCGFPKIIELPTKGPILAYVNGSLWNKLIRTDIINDIRVPEFNVGEDLSFMLALYPRCKRIACIDEVLIHYQVRETSVISNTKIESVYAFSDELYRLWRLNGQQWYRDTLMLIIFIHIGISMVSRLADNPENDIDKIIKDISRMFAERYNWFRECYALKAGALIPFGVKGLGLWAAKICYRTGCFPLFIFMYKFVTHTLRIDIKF